ncbi:MAG: single-stranded DNA-binding protein [Verrucomicrobiota bacterium]
MKNLNKVMLIGNLTRDPEVRETPRGATVAELGIALNRTIPGENGEKREETTFVDVVLWSRLAELAGKFLKKGRSVYIEGRLQTDTWEDRETGKRRSKTKIVGERMEFGDAPAKSGADGGEKSRRNQGTERYQEA